MTFQQKLLIVVLSAEVILTLVTGWRRSAALLACCDKELHYHSQHALGLF